MDFELDLGWKREKLEREMVSKIAMKIDRKK